MNSTGRKILIIVIISSLGGGFGGGIWFSKYQYGIPLPPVIQKIINQSTGQPGDLDFSLFWEVWTKLNEKYVDSSKLDNQKMLYGAIEGMVNSVGDPYTVFFEPVVSQKFQEEVSGAFGGVGIEIGKRNGGITVIAPLKDSPADKAGIKAGDKIIKVDTKPTEGKSVEEVVNLIRGKKGTKVVLTISRDGETKDYELTRDTIRIPSLKWEMLDGGVAYIQIYTFNQNVDSDFEKAAQEILKSPATKLIVDLRNNPGGLLDSAINLAGWFLDENQVVTMEEFRDGSREEFRSKGGGALKIYPTIILTNGGSASASEILAGALHDNRGIQIVGEKSFGKGSVQELENFKNGSSLKVTIAKWLTPNGRSITDLGIEPNYEVKLPENPEEGTLEFGKPGKDPQLDKALDLLK
ncbi:MAG: S41 family peptidase [Candidatus Taylorbacteria bacterium]|nr:S41 family peptidase [Candidatus Taylorbacteria bacterium]